MDDSTIIFRVREVKQMFARGISEVEVRDVLEDGETIEESPDDLPYSFRLLLGWVDNRPLHIVVSMVDASTIAVVTVYEPTDSRWEPGFRARKKP